MAASTEQSRPDPNHPCGPRDTEVDAPVCRRPTLMGRRCGGRAAHGTGSDHRSAAQLYIDFYCFKNSQVCPCSMCLCSAFASGRFV